MGFLTASQAVAMSAVARVMAPPPPPDITRWCEENVEFDDRSALPGPFRIERFPFLREIHAVLSPEHPAREVTLRGSAQFGKTVSVIQPTLGAWFCYAPLDALVVHPTGSTADEWVSRKWNPFREQAPALVEIFGDSRGGDRRDTLSNQESLDRTRSLRVTSAQSDADLHGTTRKLVVMDDLSKFSSDGKGDPETEAVARADSYDDAKILRVSVPTIENACRVSRAFERGDQRYFHVPCPHCDHFAPLTWDNFRKSIHPDRLDQPHFTCEECGAAIYHSDKRKMLARCKWVAHNPGGDHPSFHIWRAYVPQRDWASIAIAYANTMGWTRTKAGGSQAPESVEAETEQTFFNQVLGLPYAQSSGGPDWEGLRNRVENAELADQRAPATVPAAGVILSAGVDCQQDRIEVHVVAFGPNYRRYVVDYRVIPHPITSDEGVKALNALLKAEWSTELGRKLPLDIMAIDMGAYTENCWSFAKAHPWSRVILVKGSGAQTGPVMTPMRFDRRKDGKAKRRQKRAFMLNVSQMKADFYAWLDVEDPVARGYIHFCQDLGDEYFRQVTSEVRVLERSRVGVLSSRWKLVDPKRRNEALDTMLYAEAAARRKGWTSMTAEEWAQLEEVRAAPPETPQGDLFAKEAARPTDVQAAPAPAPKPVKEQTRKPADNWLQGRGGNWLR